MMAQGVTVVQAALAAVAQVIPATTATNAAKVVTSAGFHLTSEGFILFTNANSAMNHDQELEAWNREGATLTSEAAREPLSPSGRPIRKTNPRSFVCYLTAWSITNSMILAMPAQKTWGVYMRALSNWIRIQEWPIPNV